MKLLGKTNIILIATLVVLVALSSIFFFRIDLTSDKRYSISPLTRQLMKSTKAPVHVTVYLDGDLNPGFQRLKQSAVDMLQEMGVYAGDELTVDFENPSAAGSAGEREKKYGELSAQGMTATAIYERDKEGKAIQKIVFPWIKMRYNDKSVVVCLLKNVHGNSGEENLNISIENLEFEITDGIRRLTNTTIPKIAFIEGHGELTEAETYDISKALSRYFQIDRGVLGGDANILNQYKAIIVAKPQQPFSESDKYIIDQYIMNGGRVLWLLDGVRVSKESLSKSGLSPAIELDLNLTDQLFKYGVRINPGLLQDVQCASVPVNIAQAGAQPQFEPSPWFYAPLLLTSTEHPITKNITEVRSEFTSALEVVGNHQAISASLLLATSDHSHIVAVPSTIDLSNMPKANDKAYFDKQYLPVAVLVEGSFSSDFENRLRPKEIVSAPAFMGKSKNTKQIVVADGDIIRNETNGIASDSTTLPLGFDRYMNQQFGNRDFVLNSVLYLTDDAGWLGLRSRTLQLRLLNKSVVSEERLFWQCVNVGLPLLLLLAGGVGYGLYRKKKYTK
jgi:ABC-2 type transport system permease protein